MLAERRGERVAKLATLRARCARCLTSSWCTRRTRAEKELRLLSRDWQWQVSCVEGAVAGGMLAMVRREVCSVASVSYEVIVPGRAMAVDVASEGGAPVGVHNF